MRNRLGAKNDAFRDKLEFKAFVNRSKCIANNLAVYGRLGSQYVEVLNKLRQNDFFLYSVGEAHSFVNSDTSPARLVEHILSRQA